MTLSNKELTTLNAIGEDLKAQLSNIVSQLPAQAQTIRGMSKHLDYNNSNSQRILKSINIVNTGKDVVCLVPGVLGLNEFLEKAKPFINEQDYQSGRNLIQLFARTIKLNFNSHAELKRKLTSINSKSELVSTSSELDKRKIFFNAAKELLGASVDSLFSGHIISENVDNNKYLHEVAMISKKKVVRKERSAPCVLFYTHPHPVNFSKPSIVTKSTTNQNKKFHIGIVDEYSTDNLIDYFADFSPSNLGLAFDDMPDAASFDATFILSNPDEIRNPLVEQSKCSSTFISVKSPTKKLTMVVFLERKIDMRSSVNIGCYHSSQKVEAKELRNSDAWTEHLPGVPELKIVNLDSSNSNSPALAEVQELSQYMFGYAKLDRKDFVCYLLEVDYPIWSSTYRIYFDHC